LVEKTSALAAGEANGVRGIWSGGHATKIAGELAREFPVGFECCFGVQTNVVVNRHKHSENNEFRRGFHVGFDQAFNSMFKFEFQIFTPAGENFRLGLFYHGFVKADSRIPIKDFYRNKINP
jgi:hypothetical protein